MTKAKVLMKTSKKVMATKMFVMNTLWKAMIGYEGIWLGLFKFFSRIVLTALSKGNQVSRKPIARGNIFHK